MDFRTKVSRWEFEELCSDLLEQVGDPVEQALQSADMTMVSHFCNDVLHFSL
jgi:molecular chaperone DnaK (HSP70)